MTDDAPARPRRRGRDAVLAARAPRPAPSPSPAPETLDDAVLTREGLSVPAAAGPDAEPGPAAGRTRLIACGALAREILALIRANGWTHLDLRCLPAQLHLRPDLIPDAVEAEVRRARGRFDAVKVVYADCGTGGLLEARCAELDVEMIPGPHCYSFFDGNAVFAARGDREMRAFYLTDFLVRQFDAFVWRPMGLDRHPELRETLFGNYETLVHLAQVEDPALDAAAREAARRLGLAHQRRFTGYGDLEDFLAAAAEGARA